MPDLWKHENDYWYVLYGPRLKQRVSARTKDRGQADIFLANFIAGSLNPTTNDPLVGDLLDQYETEHGPEVRSLASLQFSVRPLKKHLGLLRPGHITPPVTKQYAKDRGASPGTILRDMGALRAALKWAVDHQRISGFPHIKNPVKVPRARDRWLSRDEGKALLDACAEPHTKLFGMLALMTAARSSAILELTWGQIDFDRRLIDYGEGHGNKRRAIAPINDQLLEMLKAAKLFAGDEPDGPVVEFRGKSVASVTNGFRTACVRAGLKGVTPHILRHAAASWMAEAGISFREIAKMLGDTEDMVEKTYAKFSPGFLRDASNALQFK